MVFINELFHCQIVYLCVKNINWSLELRKFVQYLIILETSNQLKENCTQMIIIVFFFFIICFFFNFSVWRNYQKRVGLMRHWYLLYLYGDTRCTESSEIVWVELLTCFGLTQQFKRLLNRWIFTSIRGKNYKIVYSIFLHKDFPIHATKSGA